MVDNSNSPELTINYELNSIKTKNYSFSISLTDLNHDSQSFKTFNCDAINTFVK